jgi:hypothetical protein
MAIIPFPIYNLEMVGARFFSHIILTRKEWRMFSSEVELRVLPADAMWFQYKRGTINY